MSERYALFTTLITSINRLIKKIKFVEMTKYDLLAPHVSCLFYLNKFNGLTASQLVDLSKDDKGLVSRSLTYLEEKKYIVYDDTNKKRYNAEIKLTTLGQEVSNIIVDKIDAIFEEASKGIDDNKRTILYECLNIVNDNLETIVSRMEEN
ncbi:MAG: MarR family winged helix-turn-helix transcriptional regulator [Bacilli bacterium]